MNKQLFFLLCWFWSVSAFSQSAIWYVNQAATGANTGQSWVNAYQDLHLALAQAQSGDAIWVASGAYFPDNGHDRDRSFVLKSGVKLYGGFAGHETALGQRNIPANPVMLSGNIGDTADSTDNSYTILYMAYPDSSTRLDGLIFRHGFARNDTNFYSNVPTTCGGAVYIMAQNGKGLPVFSHCTFQDNVARFNGGAVYVQGQGTQGSTPLFHQCNFINNQARIGGAVYLSGGNNFDRGIEFDHCRFEGNYALTQGGAIYFYNTLGNEQLDFMNCIVTHNNCASFGSFFQYLKTSTNPLSINFESCHIFSNKPDASSLINVENFGQAYKIKFVMNNCQIFDNVLSHPFGDPTTLINIYGEYSNNNIDSFIITRNIINHGEIIWHSFKNSYVVCSNNNFYNKAGVANTGNKIEIFDNFFNDSGVGFSIEGSLNASCKVYNNIFSNGSPLFASSWYYWNDAWHTDSVFIVNNLFVNNETAIYQGRSLSDSVRYVTFLMNNIFANVDKILSPSNTYSGYETDIYSYFSHNLMDRQCDSLGERVICGPGNIVANDALFVDTSALNFHLQPCSPAINRGDNSLLAWLGILQDIDGHPRISEGLVDIGPYESPGFVLNAPPEIRPACANSPGGQVRLSPSHGCEPYTYQWQPPAGAGPVLSDLPPGAYAYTVTDAAGRQITDTVQVPSAPNPVLSPLVGDVSCGAQLGGTASVVVSSGTAPYTYLWSTGADSSQIGQLPAGVYTVHVIDANGCHDSTTMTVALQGQITLMVDGQTISCFDAADGTLSAAVVNGQSPVSYQWSEGSQDSVLTNLGPGQYSVTATDYYGCTASFVFKLSQPMALEVSAVAMPTASLQTPNGSAQAFPVFGGTPPYTYSWSTGSQGQIITSLPPGIYTVTVTDAHDCTATATAEVKLVSGTVEPSVQVAVWPNPVVDQLAFRVTGDQASVWRVGLLDAMGREVGAGELAAGRLVLDVSGLPAGAYAWVLKDTDGHVLREGKVVK